MLLWNSSFALVFVLLTGACGFTEPPAGAPAPREVPIAALVRSLGGAEYATREAATLRLGKLTHVPAELQAATESDEPELRTRARALVAVIQRNRGEQLLPRAERFARHGEIDLFVASTAELHLRANDQRLWEPSLTISRALLTKAELVGARTPRECPATFPSVAAYKRFCNPRFTLVGGTYARIDKPNAGQPPGWYPELIQSGGIAEDNSLVYNVVISRAHVRVKGAVLTSVVFLNGSTEIGRQVSRSVIVADGDIEIGETVTDALIIARGNIKVKQGASASVLIAGGKIQLENQAQRVNGGKDVTLKEEKDANPLKFVTFFELHRVGIETKLEGGAVVVAKVATKSEAERAGVKAGDTVLSVGGTKPTDAEHLRRALRDALALGDAKVQLKRGTETLTVTLALPEESRDR